MFSPAELEKQLNSGKINIPDGKKAAFVVHGDLVDGTVTAAFAYKTGDNWQVGTVVDWSHEKGIDAGFNVHWSR